ncbi:diaminopropionate ammonia-lyase [Pseudomonas juntendi]|uniref:Diaminopropionate ammonia-lyase n=1 Tax=Pseudomonas juntendi TaxID=2666183 RepID=A0A7W2LY34_9PSED|nr:diaminopropionate ammonia-lyase [Pseudomonas juntendi]MBA6133881.1 diaminopropionate ammonia-lyase [Pseudomonas juntendi]MBA6149191.1 diaminopropionate ammonia-lyase [Pseudomonas juntendi]
MSIKVVPNPNYGKRTAASSPMLACLEADKVDSVLAFHRSIEGYAPTPLVRLRHLSSQLGVKSVYVKDESFRFGLNAFKALGGSYAIANYLANKLGMDISDLPYDRLISEEIRDRLGEVTFVTATDGNHGRGVAWTAQKLRQKCVVHMPKGAAFERLENIRALGAEVDITDMNYDDAVRLSSREAEENGWVLVQDTSWPGYEDIPRSIIQGYTTMLAEAVEQLEKEHGGQRPTHLFVQAGVGALATATVGYFVNLYGSSDEGGPTIVVVEPENASCIFDTLRAEDGKIHAVGGNLQTIMAGLACGEPVTVGIDLLANYVDFVVSLPDYVAAQGMRTLSSPVRARDGDPTTDAEKATDDRIISGESGAAPFGFAYEVLTNPGLAEVKEVLGINSESVLFFLSTEGDTDRASFDAIVNNGAYAHPSAYQASTPAKEI